MCVSLSGISVGRVCSDWSLRTGKCLTIVSPEDTVQAAAPCSQPPRVIICPTLKKKKKSFVPKPDVFMRVVIAATLSHVECFHSFISCLSIYLCQDVMDLVGVWCSRNFKMMSAQGQEFCGGMTLHGFVVLGGEFSCLQEL